MPSRSAPAEPALRRLVLFSWIALATVGMVITVITMWPGPPDPAGQSTLREFLERAHRDGLPTWIGFDLVEFGANVLMFVPVGLFGAMALRRHRWLIVPIGTVASLVIEIVQAMVLPLRFGTGRDVISNTLGALAGYLLALAFIGYLRRRTRRARPAVAAPAPVY